MKVVVFTSVWDPEEICYVLDAMLRFMCFNSWSTVGGAVLRVWRIIGSHSLLLHLREWVIRGRLYRLLNLVPMLSNSLFPGSHGHCCAFWLARLELNQTLLLLVASFRHFILIESKMRVLCSWDRGHSGGSCRMWQWRLGRLRVEDVLPWPSMVLNNWKLQGRVCRDTVLTFQIN